ncbi:hypothetical protein CVS40_11683 [Lucilia cuprina]|nr:hypothetical protein CVS40_11683 [Lucilia cuprina]
MRQDIGTVHRPEERILSGRKKRNKQFNDNRNISVQHNSIEEGEVLDDNSEMTLLENRIRSNIQSSLHGELSHLKNVVERLSQQFQELNLNASKEPEWPRDPFQIPLNRQNFIFHRSGIPSLTAESAHFIQNEYNFPPPRSNVPHSTAPSLNASRERPSLSITSINNSGKTASLITSWNITFSGWNMPVEKLIYMITSLTKDCLAGDFILLCEHSHILFTSKAKEWYWRYRSTVGQMEWDRLCNALRVHFNDHLSDLDVREIEQELIEILRRNLKPYLRRELFYLQINIVSHLRQLILRRETLSSELERNQKVFRRHINEIDLDANLEDKLLEEVCEIRRQKEEVGKEKTICWN